MKWLCKLPLQQVRKSADPLDVIRSGMGNARLMKTGLIQGFSS